MRKKKERPKTQLSGNDPSIDTAGTEYAANEMVEPPVEISPLICEDLSLCELTKVSLHILQSGDSDLLNSEAERLFKEAQQLDRRRYRERAEYFLQTAKLLAEVSKDHRETDSYALSLEKPLLNYTWVMGDYLFLKGDLDPARNYYLEHIRLTKGTLSRHTLTCIVNYFQTFLTVQEQRKQLASIMSDTPPNIGNPYTMLFLIIEKWGQLADTANNPDQELARGLLELACVSDQISKNVSKAFANNEGMRQLLLPLLELLSKQFSVNLTSDEPSDFFRQLVQYRHFSNKRQESQLNELIAKMSEKWSLEQVEEELADFTIYQREWSATDRTFFATVRDLIRKSVLYFLGEGGFIEKERLATSVIHDGDTFLHDLDEHPTLLGKAYFAQIVYHLKQVVEKEYQELQQISLPNLVPSIAKAIWIHGKDSLQRECHIDVTNEGEITAQDVKIRVLPSETSDYVEDPHPYSVGPIYTRPYVGSIVIPITLTKKAIDLDAIDLVVRLEYFNRDNTKKETGPIHLRLPLWDEVRFTPIKNPYQTGMPVVDSRMFLGRQELVEELALELTNENRTSAVVIYGQKRSGKTSILRNLEKYLEKTRFDSYSQVIPVYFSMQSVLLGLDGVSQIIPGMFYIMADEITHKYRKAGLEQVDDLEWEQLIAPQSPIIKFRTYLDKIRRLPGTRLVLLIDEFTELSDFIDMGYIDHSIMKFLKSLIEQGFFSCVICGIDTMPYVLNRYANELAVADPRMVGYLSQDAASELIQRPICLPEGQSRFTSPRVIEELIKLTAGSPYYIQFVCHHLVDYMNRVQSAAITGADLDRVVNDMIFGPKALDPYTRFDNLTRYKDDETRDTRETIIEGLFLHLLADETRTRQYAPFSAIQQRAPFVEEVELLQIAEQLENRQVIVRSVGTVRQYRIVVDLFRRWINARRPMDSEALNKFRKQLEKAAE